MNAQDNKENALTHQAVGVSLLLMDRKMDRHISEALLKIHKNQRMFFLYTLK
jgi:hypothetical protein